MYLFFRWGKCSLAYRTLRPLGPWVERLTAWIYLKLTSSRIIKTVKVVKVGSLRLNFFWCIILGNQYIISRRGRRWTTSCKILVSHCKELFDVVFFLLSLSTFSLFATMKVQLVLKILMMNISSKCKIHTNLAFAFGLN